MSRKINTYAVYNTDDGVNETVTTIDAVSEEQAIEIYVTENNLEEFPEGWFVEDIRA